MTRRITDICPYAYLIAHIDSELARQGVTTKKFEVKTDRRGVYRTQTYEPGSEMNPILKFTFSELFSFTYDELFRAGGNSWFAVEMTLEFGRDDTKRRWTLKVTRSQLVIEFDVRLDPDLPETEPAGYRIWREFILREALDQALEFKQLESDSINREAWSTDFEACRLNSVPSGLQTLLDHIWFRLAWPC